MLGRPWRIEFPAGWGAPPSVSFAKLQSWTESRDEGIRCFSGHRHLQKRFDFPASLAQKALFGTG